MAERLSDLGDKLVHIFVGAERKKFSIHKKLICKSGEFFRAAFQENGFKEGVENKMDLPEDKPHIFQAFVNWMYARQIGNLRKRIPDLNTEDNHDIETIELYIFADKYQNKQLMNLAMDSLQDSFKNGLEFVLLEEAELIFEFTNSDSPLRCFAVAVMAHGILSDDVPTDPGFVEVFRRVDGMLLETMMRVQYVKAMFKRDNPNPRIRMKSSECINIVGLGICEYHDHSSDESCDTLSNYTLGEED